MARGAVLQFEFAEISLVGAREENQDRIAAVVDAQCALIAAFDGMGGHADGARAAEIARTTLLARFASQAHPLIDPLSFLHMTLGAAHTEMILEGNEVSGEMDDEAKALV